MKHGYGLEAEKRILLAAQIINNVSDIACFHYQKKISSTIKEDLSLVTFVDTLIEDTIKKAIISKFPDDGIIGEEFGTKESKNGFVWTIDPIDGTIAYTHGMPLFSTMIGLIHGDHILYGIINFPLLKETIYAINGKGTFWKRANSKRFYKCCSSSVKDLNQVTFSHSGINYFSDKNNLEIYSKLQKYAKYTRTWGDAYGHVLVATGRIHIMMDCTLNIWDIVPLKIVVEEAQGCFLTMPKFNISSTYKSIRALSCANKALIKKIKN